MVPCSGISSELKGNAVELSSENSVDTEAFCPQATDQELKEIDLYGDV
jgi:hypothetical protein